MTATGSDRHVQRADLRPPPAPDNASRFFWDAARQEQLVVQCCAACRRMQYPPEVVCIFCQSDSLEPSQISGKGVIYSYAIVERAFHPGFVSQLPYVVALIELEEQAGLRIFANIVDCDAERLFVGEPVEVTFERRGAVTLPQFRPLGNPHE
jgi:uncharacterized OB-fold protein